MECTNDLRIHWMIKAGMSCMRETQIHVMILKLKAVTGVTPGLVPADLMYFKPLPLLD